MSSRGKGFCELAFPSDSLGRNRWILTVSVTGMFELSYIAMGKSTSPQGKL